MTFCSNKGAILSYAFYDFILTKMYPVYSAFRWLHYGCIGVILAALRQCKLRISQNTTWYKEPSPIMHCHSGPDQKNKKQHFVQLGFSSHLISFRNFNMRLS